MRLTIAINVLVENIMDYKVSYYICDKDGNIDLVEGKNVTARATSRKSLRNALKRLIREEYQNRGNIVQSIASIEVHYFVSINSVCNDNVLEKFVKLAQNGQKHINKET